MKPNYTQEDLDPEIEAKIAAFEIAARPLVPAWLTKAILDDHPLIFGKDAEVARYHAGEHIHREVLRHLGIEDEAETNPDIEDWKQAAASLRTHAEELRQYRGAATSTETKPSESQKT